MQEWVDQMVFGNLLNVPKINKASLMLEEKIKKLETAEKDLSRIKGIGASTIEKLNENGVHNVEQLRVLPMVRIKTIIKSPIAQNAIERFLDELNSIK